MKLVCRTNRRDAVPPEIANGRPGIDAVVTSALEYHGRDDMSVSFVGTHTVASS